MLSIGQTMAIQEYQRYASQRGKGQERVIIVSKDVKKIHKSSPSISRDHSKYLEDDGVRASEL